MCSTRQLSSARFSSQIAILKSRRGSKQPFHTIGKCGQVRACGSIVPYSTIGEIVSVSTGTARSRSKKSAAESAKRMRYSGVHLHTFTSRFCIDVRFRSCDSILEYVDYPFQNHYFVQSIRITSRIRRNKRRSGLSVDPLSFYLRSCKYSFQVR